MIEYKINDKVILEEIVPFLTQMDREARKELYFSVRNPYKEINAIKNSDVITAREYKICPRCKGTARICYTTNYMDCPKCAGIGKIIDKLVGITRIVSDKTYYFYITDVMVVPKMRKKGIATEMVKKAVKYCKQKGYIKIFLVPVKGLEKFYSKFGFKISNYQQMVILQKGICNG